MAGTRPALRHQRGTSIEFADLVMIEKGSALLLGWFMTRFVEAGRPRTLTILHKSTGAHHFDEAIRLWRATLPPRLRLPSLNPDEHWKSVPRFLYHEIEPVLLEKERLHASLHAAERWSERRRFFTVGHTFVQAWASSIFTDRSVILGIAEEPFERNMHAFGANVIVVPYEWITAATVVERVVQKVVARELRIDISNGDGSTTIHLPFDGSRDEGEAVAAIVRPR